MKINLPSSLELSDVYVNEPFPIYEMENILEKNIYDKLREEFPDKAFFTEGYGSGGKLTFNNTNPYLFHKFLEQSETWKTFIQTINNEVMVKKLFNLMMHDIKKIPERNKFPRKILQENIKLVQIWDEGYFSKAYNKIRKLIRLNPVSVLFEFSRIGNDCYIPPHTEESKKIFNLLLYFPNRDLSEFDKNRLGTNFYKRSKDNLNIWESYTMEENEAVNFYKNYDLFYKTKFSENKFIGLIKTSNSWHDTNKFNNLTEDRKSFNIFFYQY